MPFLGSEGPALFRGGFSLGPRSLPQPTQSLPHTHILAARLDLLAVLEPLEGKIWVTDLYHQLDLLAPVHLVGWIQLLREGWRLRDAGQVELRGPYCQSCQVSLPRPSALQGQKKAKVKSLEVPEKRTLLLFRLEASKRLVQAPHI